MHTRTHAHTLAHTAGHQRRDVPGQLMPSSACPPSPATGSASAQAPQALPTGSTAGPCARPAGGDNVLLPRPPRAPGWAPGFTENAHQSWPWPSPASPAPLPAAPMLYAPHPSQHQPASSPAHLSCSFTPQLTLGPRLLPRAVSQDRGHSRPQTQAQSRATAGSRPEA